MATEKNAEIQQALTAANALHILTIGEVNRFLDLGGMVRLFLADGHIGFETSMEAVERSGIVISSRLMRLGQARDRGKPRSQP